MNLPNKLTIARIIAVPFFIAAYYLEWHLVAFLIFRFFLLYKTFTF